MPDLAVEPRERLTGDAPAVVELGRAPDGLPFLLAVEAPPAPHVETMRGRRVYRTVATIGDLFGLTLLGRLLGGFGPMAFDEGSANPDRVPIAAADWPDPVAGVATNGHLAVPVDGSPPLVVQVLPELDQPVRSMRPLEPEDLTRLTSARFHAGEVTGALTDEAAYRAALDNADRVCWSVSRADLATQIAELADALQALHDSDLVHGDVKPGNGLLTPEGPRPIDPVDVVVGQGCPAATPSWAAPEQIFGWPVSPATDVFALGLMTARLVGAALHGEERTFILPLGGIAVQRVRRIVEPALYFDHPELDANARQAWSAFVLHCIDSNPEHRLPDAGAFARELRDLLGNRPAPGRLWVGGLPGELVRGVPIDGVLQPAWLVRDRS